MDPLFPLILIHCDSGYPRGGAGVRVAKPGNTEAVRPCRATGMAAGSAYSRSWRLSVGSSGTDWVGRSLSRSCISIHRPASKRVHNIMHVFPELSAEGVRGSDPPQGSCGSCSSSEKTLQGSCSEEERQWRGGFGDWEGGEQQEKKWRRIMQIMACGDHVVMILVHEREKKCKRIQQFAGMLTFLAHLLKSCILSVNFFFTERVKKINI
jgi:hypothetical protein